MSHQDDADGLASRFSAMEVELASLRDENARLRHLLGLDTAKPGSAGCVATEFFGGVRNAPDWLEHIDHQSPPEAKIRLFRELFAGRSDVYAIRWQNAGTGKAGWSPAVRGGWSKARDRDRGVLAVHR